MSDLIPEFITLWNGGSAFKLRAWGFYSTERFSILDTLCIRNAGLLQNQHPAHVWHQRIAALNVISIHSNQIPERGRRATVFVPAHLCVPAPSASPTQNRYPKYITCKKTDNNYEVLLPPFLLADFFKNNRRPAVSVPCGAERRGNHNQKLKGS